MEPSNYILTKLLPEQVSAQWDKISEGISKSMPFQYRDKSVAVNNILHAALRDEVQVWLGIDFGEEWHLVYGLIVTAIVGGGYIDPKRLWIYCLHGYRPIPKKLWKVSLDTLKKYAVYNDCDEIMAYSNVPRVIEMATNGLHGDASTRLIIFNAREELSYAKK